MFLLSVIFGMVGSLTFYWGLTKPPTSYGRNYIYDLWTVLFQPVESLTEMMKSSVPPTTCCLDFLKPTCVVKWPKWLFPAGKPIYFGGPDPIYRENMRERVAVATCVELPCLSHSQVTVLQPSNVAGGFTAYHFKHGFRCESLPRKHKDVAFVHETGDDIGDLAQVNLLRIMEADYLHTFTWCISQ